MKKNLIITYEHHQAFERSLDMLDNSLNEMRRVAYNLMPEALVKSGLNAALNDFCEEVNNSGLLQVTYQSIGIEDAAIGQPATISIYRIVQELVNNAIRHAVARSAMVQVSRSNDIVRIRVEDDGAGFDLSKLKASRGNGWNNIKDGVSSLKGRIDVQSAKEKGTSVHIELNI